MLPGVLGASLPPIPKEQASAASGKTIHKRGLIDSIDEIRLVRDLRNEIVHEYRLANMQKLFQSIIAQTPGLFSLLDRIRDYCRQYENEGE